MDRLVLGCGTVGRSFLDRLGAGSASVLVLVEDADSAESLRDGGVDARSVDLTQGAAVRTVAGAVDSIVIAYDSPLKTRAIARTARTVYPNAFIMACLDTTATPEDHQEIAEYVDRILETQAETTSTVLERAGDPGIRPRKLQRILRNIDESLAIVTHDNPDPDAIASAVGLQRIAEAADTPADVCYFGEISHHENRALVNLLEFDLQNLAGDASLDSYSGFALVDHSRPGINDGLPESTPIDIVVDHHPPRAPVEARFVDLRSDVGATSTLICEYLETFEIPWTPAVATGLLFGIRTDTQDFTREVATADFHAAATLVEHADSGALQRIESPSMTADTLDIIAAAIRNRERDDDVLTTYAGEISNRDALAQAADKLLELEGVATTLVYGYIDDVVYISARAYGTDLDLGEALRDAFGQIGSAGGHAQMAGAQIPIGILLDGTTEPEHSDVIQDIITERFFDTLGIHTSHAAGHIYRDFLSTDDH